MMEIIVTMLRKSKRRFELEYKCLINNQRKIERMEQQIE